MDGIIDVLADGKRSFDAFKPLFQFFDFSFVSVVRRKLKPQDQTNSESGNSQGNIGKRDAKQCVQTRYHVLLTPLAQLQKEDTSSFV